MTDMPTNITRKEYEELIKKERCNRSFVSLEDAMNQYREMNGIKLDGKIILDSLMKKETVVSEVIERKETKVSDLNTYNNLVRIDAIYDALDMPDINQANTLLTKYRVGVLLNPNIRSTKGQLLCAQFVVGGTILKYNAHIDCIQIDSVQSNIVENEFPRMTFDRFLDFKKKKKRIPEYYKKNFDQKTGNLVIVDDEYAIFEFTLDWDFIPVLCRITIPELRASFIDEDNKDLLGLIRRLEDCIGLH